MIAFQILPECEIHQYCSPPKKPIRIIPLLWDVEIKSVQPALLRLVWRHWSSKATQKRTCAGDSHVRRKTRDQARISPEGSLEITLFLGIEMPGDHLAEDDVARLSQDAVAEDRGSSGLSAEIVAGRDYADRQGKLRRMLS